MPNFLTDPLTNAPSRLAKMLSEQISPPNQVGSPMRGFMSGAVDAMGRMGDDATSPLGMAMTMLPAAGLMRARGLLKAAPAVEQAMVSSRPLVKRGAEAAADITPEFNNAAEAFEHYWKTANKARGTMKDVPRNRTAVQLERERRSIQRPYRMEE